MVEITHTVLSVIRFTGLPVEPFTEDGDLIVSTVAVGIYIVVVIKHLGIVPEGAC